MILGFICSKPKNCGVGHCKNMPPKMATELRNSTNTTNIAIILALGRNEPITNPPTIVPIAIVATDVMPVKNDALEADCLYCSSIYLGLTI